MELAAIQTRVGAVHPDALVPTDEGATYLSIVPEQWAEVAQLLRTDEELRFNVLMCLTGFDRGAGEPLGVAYNLHSMEKLHKLEVRIEAPRDDGKIPSVAQIWRTAEWHEREAFDLFGITFVGHPDLRRILLPEDWEGYPLRKDYEEPDYYRGIPVPKDKRGWE